MRGREKKYGKYGEYERHKINLTVAKKFDIIKKAKNFAEKIHNMEETIMSATAKKVLKIIISIVYILWGLWSPISALKAILDLNVGAIASAAVGVLMLLAGIFGLIGIKKIKCRIFGIVIFVCSLLAVVAALPSISINAIITAVLAWLFIVCV